MAQLAQPELPVDRGEFVVLGDPRRALTDLWKRWQSEASIRWTRLAEHTSAQWGVLDAAMGNKRKDVPRRSRACAT